MASPKPELISEIHAAYGDRTGEWFDTNPVHVQVRGHVIAKRILGKMSFVKINDGTGELMLFLRRDDLEAQQDAFENLRVGDTFGGAGQLFRTKTQELCIRANAVTVDPQSRHRSEEHTSEL